MKTLINLTAFALLAVACNNSPKATSTAKVDSVKILKDSLKLDSFKRAEAEKKELEQKVKAEQQVVARDASTPRERTETYRSSTSSETVPVETEKKKGWSSAAKGAAIGGGAGVVSGILIDKNNARGAIIGGAVGAGTGYLIGRDQDKKSGRVQKDEK